MRLLHVFLSSEDCCIIMRFLFDKTKKFKNVLIQFICYKKSRDAVAIRSQIKWKAFKINKKEYKIKLDNRNLIKLELDKLMGENQLNTDRKYFMV